MKLLEPSPSQIFLPCKAARLLYLQNPIFHSNAEAFSRIHLLKSVGNSFWPVQVCRTITAEVEGDVPFRRQASSAQQTRYPVGPHTAPTRLQTPTPARANLDSPSKTLSKLNSASHTGKLKTGSQNPNQTGKKNDCKKNCLLFYSRAEKTSDNR